MHELANRSLRSFASGWEFEDWIRRAVEQALADDTQALAGPFEGGDDGPSHTGHHASPTGAVTARGASGPLAPAEQLQLEDVEER